MKVEEAKETGFCFGVRRAVRLFEEAVQEHGKVETLGAVVHNRQVSDNLAGMGVHAIDGLEQLRGRVVGVPSHGVGRKTMDEIQARGLQIVDATCPRVRRAQNAAQKLARAGFSVVIFGDEKHPEVRGVLDWADDKGIVTSDALIAWPNGKTPRRIGVMCQTTQNAEYFTQFVHKLMDLYLPHVEELRVVNTICNTTKQRQEAALELARRVELMIIVGGYHSANTKRLAEICSSAGVDTHHIETAAELKDEWLGAARVGVAAGASTPDEVVKEVINRLKEIGAKDGSR